MRPALAALALIGVVVAGCIDGIGPRPRPGTDEAGEPGNGGGSSVLHWFEMRPRVITQGTTDSVTLTVSVTGTPQFVTVQTRTGQPVDLQRVGDLYMARVPAANLLIGYRVGDLHQLGGLIQIVSDSVREYALVVNVKDETVPNANLATIAPGMQRSDHVVNMRHDGIAAGSPVPASVIRSFYNFFPDEFDFIAVTEPVRSARPMFYSMIRNNVRGIGLDLLDTGAGFGSAARLQGIIQFPDHAELDLARTDNIHEIAHQWMNYLEHPLLSPARTHWPLSTLAQGVMGRRHPVTGNAVAFPFDLTERADGTFLVSQTATPRFFNDMELYLMGLLPPDSVQPHVVFADQNQQSQLRNGGILRGRVDTVRIADVIETNGPRIPAANTDQNNLRIATIVLTRGGILTRHELDFFEHVAVRGESRVPLIFSNGMIRGFTQPFFLATGSRATLGTSVRGLQ